MLFVDEPLGYFHLLLRQWLQIYPLLGHGGASRVQAHGLLEYVEMRVRLNQRIESLMTLNIDMFCSSSHQPRRLIFFLFGILSLSTTF